MNDAKRDNNNVTTLLGVSSADGITPVLIWVDPVTHRVLVDIGAGAGDVVGPASAVNNNFAAFDTTTGKLIKDSGYNVASFAAALSGTLNEIAYFNTTTTIASLAVATYPSLTELAYVKGVTSAIQTQITAKAAVGQTFFIGTTQVAINRASAALTLAGITLTTPDIGTPSAGVLTNCIGLPAASVVAGILGVTGTRMTKLWATNIESTNEPTVGGVQTKLLLAGGTMTGKTVSAGRSEVGKTYTPATGAQTVALDCAVNNMHIVSGHASGTAITFTVANATDSQPFIVSILQGGTTVSTITAWFATVRWAGGVAPTLTATLNKRDTFGFIRTGAATYDGFIIGQNC